MMTVSLVCLALGSVLLLAAVHPFTTYPLSLWLLKGMGARRPIEPDPRRRDVVRFSICCSAYNEAGVAAAMAENRLRVAGARSAEILVYDDCSADGTAAALARYADRITLVRGQTRRGKTHGMNTLVSRARGDVIVFTDANVTLAPDVLDRLATYFADPAIGVVCGHLRYTNPEESATAATGSLYWRIEEAIKSLESATGSTMGADGSLFAVRRALHRPVPDDLIDDMYLSLSILLDGHRVVRAPDVMAYERSATRARDEFQRRARIACQALNVHRALAPRFRHLAPLDQYKYLSHKWLRWLSPFTGAMGGLCLLLSALTAPQAAWLVTLGLFTTSLAALALILAPPLWRRLESILLAFAGVGLGVLQSVRGERYQTWTPAASVR